MLKNLINAPASVWVKCKSRINMMLIVFILGYVLLVATSITPSVFANSVSSVIETNAQTITSTNANDDNQYLVAGITSKIRETFRSTIQVTSDDVAVTSVSVDIVGTGIDETSTESISTENTSTEATIETVESVDTNDIEEVEKEAEEKIEEVEEIISYSFDKIGYSTGNVRIRSTATTEVDSNIIGMIYFNESISYDKYNKDWYVIESSETKTGYAYVSSKYFSDSPASYESKYISGDRRKSFMSYRAITSTGSKQYKLQLSAYTGNYGVRMYKGRYMIAVGSGISRTIGQFVDVVLENGTVIPCVLGDAKQDRHTNSNHTIGLDGGAVEFIVDTGSISRAVSSSGDMSDACDAWNSDVVEIRVYSF